MSTRGGLLDDCRGTWAVNHVVRATASRGEVKWTFLLSQRDSSVLLRSFLKFEPRGFNLRCPKLLPKRGDLYTDQSLDSILAPLFNSA